MQYEVKIVVYNPTTDKTKFAGDVYIRSFNPTVCVKPSWIRVYCGPGGMDAPEAYHDATINGTAQAKTFKENPC